MSDASVTRPNLGLTSDWNDGDSWGPKMNANIDKLDWAGMPGVKDKDLTAPPGSPGNGDAYIVKATGTGAWAGQDKNVAIWIDGAWVFYVPKERWHVWVDDENALYFYDGSAWLIYAASGGGGGGIPGGQTRYKEFTPTTFGVSPAAAERGGAGSTFLVAGFSGTADDEYGCNFVCPGDFASLTKWTITICDTGSSSGNSVWRLSIKDITTAAGDIGAAYSTAFAEVTIAAPGTNNKEASADFPAGALPTLVAGHRYKMELQRRAASDAADTCTTVLDMVLLTMQYTN